MISVSFVSKMRVKAYRLSLLPWLLRLKRHFEDCCARSKSCQGVKLVKSQRCDRMEELKWRQSAFPFPSRTWAARWMLPPAVECPSRAIGEGTISVEVCKVVGDRQLGQGEISASEECGHLKHIRSYWYAVIGPGDRDCKSFQSDAVDDKLDLHLKTTLSNH